jgi:uncharacterized protein (TIGR02611 family)
VPTQPAPEVPPRPRERSRLHRALHANRALSLATKLLVGVVGSLVVGAGFVMLVTPGPAVVVIPLGLAILSPEFEFARRWLDRAREWARRARERAEAVDPRVRRRRLAAGAAVVALVAGAGTAYVVLNDWPGWSVDSWDYVQSLAGWVPDLPGM